LNKVRLVIRLKVRLGLNDEIRTVGNNDNLIKFLTETRRRADNATDTVIILKSIIQSFRSHIPSAKPVQL